MKFKFTITGSYETKEINYPNYPKETTIEQAIELDKNAIEDEPELLFEMSGGNYNIKIESDE